MIDTVLFDMGGTLEDIWVDDESRHSSIQGVLDILHAHGIDLNMDFETAAQSINAGWERYGAYRDPRQRELKPEEIVDVDEEYSGYSDLQMYESLIAKSDQALSYLISYFEQVDWPVLICFFGDHQPALNGDFENALREAGREDTDTDLTMTEKIYTVPYFIWSNYEIPEDYSMKNSRGEDVVSTNYLGTLVRKYAGLELSAYDRYRMNQREQIPVFNFAGYMTADGDWYDLWAENSYREWIERYRTVQYYALFDRKRNGMYFVGE